MEYVNVQVLSAADNQTTNGSQVDSNQLISCSFQAFFGDNQAAGTFKLQASNDLCAYGNMAKNFTVTNWVDIPSQTAAIASGASALLTVNQLAYRWIRPVFTTTGTGTQTVALIDDTGVDQVQTIDTVLDVLGSLNSTYFLLSSVNLTSKARKNFYLWLDDGAGVDPALPGKTGIQVTYTDDDSANTIASNIRAALNALTNDFAATGANQHVIITNVAFGRVPAAADGAAPTGFAFHDTTPGVASNLNNTYFLLQDEASAHKYFVWNNVDAIGTAPVVSGRTAVPIAFSASATAATIGMALATAVAALNSSGSFNTSGTSTVTITNKTAGPFTPITDGAAPTGFTFAVTAGGSSTITVNMFALSV